MDEQRVDGVGNKKYINSCEATQAASASPPPNRL
jgi:hypothetical protein